MNKVQALLQTIGTAGANPDGSYTRSCYSKEYFAAVHIVKNWLEQLHMQTDLDAAGNIHGYLPGSDSQAQSIILGSHLDTVPSGGLFDGAYGVASALETVRRCQEQGKKLRHPLEIYGFNAEESNPLGGTFGSRALAGLVNVKQPGFAEALAAYGHTPREILACKRNFANAKCYLELHIEQGDNLYNKKIPIGVVSGIVGLIRYRVTALGQSNHAGTTMMANRRDAMVAMAKLIVAADKQCRHLDEKLVLTVGTISCWPGSENVIPGKVTCTFELRHMDHRLTDQLIVAIQAEALKIKDAAFTIEKRIDKGAMPCDPHLMQVISKAATGLGINNTIMPSGAGHDANALAHQLPVGMIFVPSVKGLSHCINEWTETKDIEAGADVLYNTVLALDAED